MMKTKVMMKVMRVIRFKMKMKKTMINLKKNHYKFNKKYQVKKRIIIKKKTNCKRKVKQIMMISIVIL